MPSYYTILHRKYISHVHCCYNAIASLRIYGALYFFIEEYTLTGQLTTINLDK